MRNRAVVSASISVVVALAACAFVPQREASAKMIVTVIHACANPALPQIIRQDYGGIARRGVPTERPDALPVITLGAPSAPLKLAVANDQTSRELGLMCVLRLQPHVGMIFVFDQDSKQEFWMKNTLIPLDMVWVRADGTVDTVAANVPKSTRDTPDDDVARRSGFGKYVIELGAGEAATDGITVGSTLKVAASL
jgi:uncharacterized membrane protein (UPF0127 family)